MADEERGIRVNARLLIPWAELTFRASRAGGPGGQHVNTSSTRIEVAWNIAESGVLDDDQRHRLRHRLQSKLSEAGVLRLVAANRRSQLQNREEVVDRLRRTVAEALVVQRRRVATKPTRGSKESRLKTKKVRADVKRLRGRVSADD